jgi:hypothetical protein
MTAQDETRRCGGFTRRVTRDHQASFPDAPVFFAGEALSVEGRETVWKGWIWCINGEGLGAWVPEFFVARSGDTCTVFRDYDSTELSVRCGDILEAGEEAAGWVWCRDREGRQGWVPARCVEEEAGCG